MHLMDVMLRRRSVRKYTSAPVPEEKLQEILQAGLLAPTSRNLKPCEFYVVRDRATLKALAQIKRAGGGMLSECSVAIAVFGDSGKADTWIEDCSIAMSYMNLMAVEQGIGSCWCQLHLRNSLAGKDAEESAREILHISNGSMRIVGILALGMPTTEPKPHTPQDADWDKVHEA